MSGASPVLVVGAGIAGLSTARALRRRAVPVTVVDRLLEPSDAGLALNLPGNAVRALGSLGIAPDLAALGAPVRRREYRNGRGRLSFAIDEDAFWRDGPTSRCVRRRDLVELLARDIPPGTVRWGTEVTAVQHTPEGVEVVMADGGIERCSFLVGADGVHSAVRSSTGGTVELRPAMLSTASWRFMTTNPGIDCWTVWSGVQGTFLVIPLDGDEVYCFALATRGGPVDADPEWLLSTFEGFPDPVPEILADALVQPESLYHSPIEEVHIPRWSQGSTVLIGDAAHATAPVWAQGAAMAAEDALVLAEVLAAEPDRRRVGPEFERRRRPRITHVQHMTDRLSRAASLPTWIRDAVLPFVGPRSYRETYGPLRTPP
jgi:2-polyprenyl-6-methoxyphenol hydroxylase-like FAD-dependent oxidoreductase